MKADLKDKNKVKNGGPSLKEIGYIANGVLQRYLRVLNLRSAIIEETATIARKLGILDTNIETWENDKKHDIIELQFDLVQKMKRVDLITPKEQSS